MDADVIVVGAGIAGLACARDLAAKGRRAIVIEKSRGVGGRAATRRIDGQPVDHGAPFFHGSDSDFLETLRAGGPAGVVEGWPRAIEGEGRPCETRALAPGEERLALVEGATSFAKRLARGLDVRLGVAVARIEADDSVEVVSTDGTALRGRTVVLTAPLPQVLPLLAGPLASEPELAALAPLLATVGYEPCLTAIVGYGDDAPRPAWDLMFPEDSMVLQTLSHDAAKRGPVARTTLVLQAHGSWSRRRLGDPGEAWVGALIEEAGRLTGAWATRPAWVQTHRWRYSRSGPAGRLAHPVLVTGRHGARFGLAGDAFSRRGGVEGAWRSGRELARRISEAS